METTIHHIEHIREAAREFISQLPQGNVVTFYGKMGVGKTTFIKAICKELGIDDTVTSPTFAIVNEYEANKSVGKDGSRPTVYHFDFYRIKRIEEVYDMGYEDYFYSGHLCFIEWPELVEDLLPDNTIRVTIEEQPDSTRTVRW